MLLTEVINDILAHPSRLGLSTVDILRTLQDGLNSDSLTNDEMGIILCDLDVFVVRFSADIMSSLRMYFSMLFFKRSDIWKYRGCPCNA